MTSTGGMDIFALPPQPIKQETIKMNRKIIIPATLALGLYATANGAAAADCKVLHESINGAQNVLVLRTGDCDDKTALRTAAKATYLAERTDTEAKGKIDVMKQVEEMVREDPPEGYNPSFWTSFFAFFFGGADVEEPDAASSLTKPGDKEEAKVDIKGGPTCEVVTKAKGDEQQFAIRLASKDAIAVDAGLTIKIRDKQQDITFSRDQIVDLKAGEKVTVDMGTSSTVAATAKAAGSMVLAGRTIACR